MGFATETQSHGASLQVSSCNRFRSLCLCASVADFHLENFRETLDDAILDRFQFQFTAQQFFHRSHRLAFAGDDQIEEAQISVDVERKPMRRHPARDVTTGVR